MSKRVINEYLIHADDIGFIKTTLDEIKHFKERDLITLWCKEPCGSYKMQHFYVKKNDPVLNYK